MLCVMPHSATRRRPVFLWEPITRKPCKTKANQYPKNTNSNFLQNSFQYKIHSISSCVEPDQNRENAKQKKIYRFFVRFTPLTLFQPSFAMRIKRERRKKQASFFSGVHSFSAKWLVMDRRILSSVG